jgi:hypothetical protein
MSVSSIGPRYRSLLRTLVRAERTWKKPEERLYIREQIRLLKESRNDTHDVVDRLDEAEKRAAVAVHYGIPFMKVPHKMDFATEKRATGAAQEHLQRAVHD